MNYLKFLKLIPITVKLLNGLYEIIKKSIEHVQRRKNISKVESALEVAKETKNTEELERLLGRPDDPK